ncbi:MAG TPA: cysteine rich repeat-containing protein [Candidatus Sulfotelmatobacter sp.]
MRSLSVLLVVCAATAAQSALADDQTTLAAIRAACAGDAQKLCAGVQPGGGRIVACLKEHKDSLSDRCKQAAGLAPNPGSSSAPGASSVSPASGANASGAARSAPATASKAKPAPASRTAPGTAGEKFVERVITDTDHGGMRAATIHLPEKWHFESKIEWHYGWVEYPFSVSSHAENPDNAEAYFQYPLLRLESTELPSQYRQYDKSHRNAPGERLPTGALYSPPQPPIKALATFIQKVRPNVANFKWLGQQDLPDLAKVLRVEGWPNQHGVAIKIGYDLDDQPVEEAFFGVYYISQATNPGVNAGMIKQTNWGFQALQSFRAPAGTLDKRMSMFCVIAKSLYVNPQWGRLAKAINDKMLADFNQKLQQGYDQLRAAQAIRDQTMKQQAAFQANFDKQEAAFRSSGGIDDSYLRDGGARSAADHWDDLIRGVDTVNDPSTGGTTQLSNLGQYHFTDGFGNYRTTDDPNYTPEKAGEVGTWTQMTAAQ